MWVSREQWMRESQWGRYANGRVCGRGSGTRLCSVVDAFVGFVDERWWRWMRSLIGVLWRLATCAQLLLPVPSSPPAPAPVPPPHHRQTPPPVHQDTHRASPSR